MKIINWAHQNNFGYIILILAGESGSADTVRDPRGFAVKFYTDEGESLIINNI